MSLQSSRTPLRKKHLNLNIESTTDREGSAESKNLSRRVLCKNIETELRHEIAQQIVELINDNERVLGTSNDLLNGFLDRSVQHPHLDTARVLNILQTDRNTRLKNLSLVAELVLKRALPNQAQDLLQALLKTPKSGLKTSLQYL